LAAKIEEERARRERIANKPTWL